MGLFIYLPKYPGKEMLNAVLTDPWCMQLFLECQKDKQSMC